MKGAKLAQDVSMQTVRQLLLPPSLTSTRLPGMTLIFEL